MTQPTSSQPTVTRDHRRQWRQCVYVYPVVSRRARGLSIGVNLNLNKACTFDCAYCQINRRARRKGLSRRAFRRMPVDLDVLRAELRLALSEAAAGRLWKETRYASAPAELRRINDIAFSGDGEPTCLPTFDKAVAVAAAEKKRAGLTDVKIVVITNATHLTRAPFQRALPILLANNGEVWAKLDAGTEAMFQRINRPRSRVTLDDICRNITAVARQMPIVIQSLFCRFNGQPPAKAELAAYCDRVQAILDAGGSIKQLQVHTIARSPAESSVTFLPDKALQAIATAIARRLPSLDITVTGGADMPPQSR